MAMSTLQKKFISSDFSKLLQETLAKHISENFKPHLRGKHLTFIG